MSKPLSNPFNIKYNEFEYYNFYKYETTERDVYVRGIPVLFMTTPRLNLSKENIEKDSFLSYLKAYDPEILNQLSYMNSGNVAGTSSPFIKLVTNTALAIDTKDLVARTREVGETYDGIKQTLPASTMDSCVGDELSIKYRDYSNLPIIKLHKAWVEYHNNVRRGIFLPSKDAVENRYIDYLSSIFYFILDFDGETIKYWCKYTGVAPLNVPYSAFSGDLNDHQIPEFSINYVYSYKEDMNPSIFRDFNKVALGKATIDWTKEVEKSCEEVIFAFKFTGTDPKNPEDFNISYKGLQKKYAIVIRTRNLSNSSKMDFRLKFIDNLDAVRNINK